MICNCCGREKDEDMGVFSSCIAPISVSFCEECQNNRAEPASLVDFRIDRGGKFSTFSLENITVYVKDSYITLEEYLKNKS